MSRDGSSRIRALLPFRQTSDYDVMFADSSARVNVHVMGHLNRVVNFVSNV
jgi:hypothetical protein